MGAWQINPWGMCLAVFAQPALGITIYLLTGLPVLWSESTAKDAIIETSSAWGWTHTIVLRNFKKQTIFSEMWITLHLLELQNSIKPDFLVRTGLWQGKTNQDLETGLKIALKHTNRPDLVSKTPICHLPPSFLPSLYYTLHCKLLIPWTHWYVRIPALPLASHSTGLIWHGTHRHQHWNKLPWATAPCRKGEHPAATATPGHFPQSAVCFVGAAL